MQILYIISFYICSCTLLMVNMKGSIMCKRGDRIPLWLKFFCTYALFLHHHLLNLLLFIKIRYLFPTLSEIMCRQLRSSVSCKHSLLVAIYTQRSLNRSKVCKVPGLFTCHKVIFIQNTIHHLIIIYLVFFRKHIRRSMMKSCNSVRTIFRNHPGLSNLLPILHLYIHSFSACF